MYDNHNFVDNRSVLPGHSALAFGVVAFTPRCRSAIMGSPSTIAIVHGSVVDCNLFGQELNCMSSSETDTWLKVHIPDWISADITTIVSHENDSTDPNTIRAVIEQDGFVDVVSHIIQTVNGYDDLGHHTGVYFDKLLLSSTTGYHRADVVANVAAAYLNRIHVADDRQFNTKTYALHGALAKGPRYFSRTSKDYAYDMHDEQLPMIDAPGGAMRDIFGYDAVTSSPTATANFSTLYNAISDHYTLAGHHVDRDDDPRPSKRIRLRSPSRPALIPRAPSEPPPTHRANAPWRRGDATTAEDAPIGDPADYEWATTDKNIKVWWGVFDDFGVDLAARKSLFALSQHSDDGYRAANHIIHVMLKRANDHHWCDNPSAYVHSTVKSARHELTPWV